MMEMLNGGGGRPVGNTECSWCRAVPGGTGIAVLTILLSKNPGVPLLQRALEKLQDLQPILRSKLRHVKSTSSYHLVVQSSPSVHINVFDLAASRRILGADGLEGEDRSSLHLVLEHELNCNSWDFHEGTNKEEEERVLHASVYELPEGKWALALRLHVVACDRRTAVSVLEELLVLAAQEEGVTNEETRQGIQPCIEDVMPSGYLCRKGLLGRGVNLLNYSMSSLRLSNLKFDNAGSPRASRVVRMTLSAEHTTKILSKCRTRGIKLCGVLAASALLTAYDIETGGVVSNKKRTGKKYGVVTLVDCRSLLDPPLTRRDLGFYHSAILNTHHLKGRETLWDTASKAYSALRSSKEEGKHFADMADLNFLMCKAIDNPGITPSSSLRTSLVSVFEDPVTDDFRDARARLGVEDYMGCASVHGIGPSLAIFDTVREGSMDCVCVFPAPLHSTKRMQEFADRMRAALVDAAAAAH
ncbi:hypothetical protein MLD38_026641 [Melastoma candidum]|uniref:Uncharacterized protein n=2 Tax=Melastoma candidum TaxID=119954 RepID=A0ACB9P2F1_9MYRT|nr:hypothetical protein MLD38_026641 [Melastoma candidum]